MKLVAAIYEIAVAKWVRCASGLPGGPKSIFEVYRAHFENYCQVLELAKDKLGIPALALSSHYFMGDGPPRQIRRSVRRDRALRPQHGTRANPARRQRTAELLSRMTAEGVRV